MNIYLNFLLSVVSSATIGSLILWLVISVLPGSTAAFSISLYGSMLILSGIVLLISSMLILLIFKSIVLNFTELPLSKSVISGACLGGLVYFLINFGIVAVASEKGIVKEFLLTGKFIYPLVIGAIYGLVFSGSSTVLSGGKQLNNKKSKEVSNCLLNKK